MLFKFFDTETTGVTPGYHEIIEYASIVIDKDFNVLFELHEYAKPMFWDRIQDDALEVNDIDRVTLSKFKNTQKDLFKKIYEFNRNLLEYDDDIHLCGHNIEFDINMVNGLYNTVGDCEFKLDDYSGKIDTWEVHNDLINREILPKTQAQRLSTLCDKYFYTDPDEVKYHSAIDDIRQNVRLYDWFKRKERRVLSVRESQISMF